MAFQLYMNDFNDYLIVSINSQQNWLSAINGCDPQFIKVYGIRYLSSDKPEESLCPSRAPFKFKDYTYGYCHRTTTNVPSNVKKEVPSAYDAGNKDHFYNTRSIRSASSFFLAGDSWSSFLNAQHPAMTKFNSTPTNDKKATSTLPLLSAHGSSGNFNFLDGHVQGVRSASEFVSFCKAEQPDTEITCTVWQKIGAWDSVTE